MALASTAYLLDPNPFPGSMGKQSVAEYMAPANIDLRVSYCHDSLRTT